MVVRTIDVKGAGYIDSIIGGIILVVQGILTFFGGLGVVGGSVLGFLSDIFAGIIMIILGLLVLLLVWEQVQYLFKTGPIIRNDLIIGIVVTIIGLVAGGSAGLLIVVGGILFIIGSI